MFLLVSFAITIWLIALSELSGWFGFEQEIVKQQTIAARKINLFIFYFFKVINKLVNSFNVTANPCVKYSLTACFLMSISLLFCVNLFQDETQLADVKMSSPTCIKPFVGCLAKSTNVWKRFKITFSVKLDLVYQYFFANFVRVTLISKMCPNDFVALVYNFYCFCSYFIYRS